MSFAFSLDLHNKARRYRKLSEHNEKKVVDMGNLYDVSNESVVSNKMLFEADTPEKIYNNQRRISTSEKFYNNGIIADMFFGEKNLSKIYKKIYLFSRIFCNKDWLLIQTIFSQLNHPIFSQKNINVVSLGNTPGIITGIYYYFMFSNINKTCENPVKNIKWHSMDVANDEHKPLFSRFKIHYNNISPVHDIDNHIIKGFADDNIYNYNNYKLAKSTIFENDKPNIIINTNPYYKAILLNMALALNTNKTVISINKLYDAPSWTDSYKKFIFLATIIYKECYLLKYPVCVKNQCYYEYYIVSCDVKNTAFVEKIRNRIEHALATSEYIKVVDEMIENTHLYKRIEEYCFRNSQSPLDELHEIIFQLKDVL